MKRNFVVAALAAAVLALPSIAVAHEPHTPGVASAAEGMREMNWQAPQIKRVLTHGWVDTFGITRIWPRPDQATVRTIAGKRCLVGGFFSFDVDDRFAFDIDEPVEIELEIESPSTPGLLLDYDHHGATRGPREVPVARSSSRWSREVIQLERARFANLGQYGTDIAIAAPGAAVTADPKEHFDPSKPHEVTICGVTIRRSHRTQRPPPVTDVEIVVLNEAGKPTPARVGLYDADGRAPLPSKDAVPIERYGDLARLIRLRIYSPDTTETWFHDNRWVFHVDGRYRTRLPAGTYDVVVTKGPEYRVARQTLKVEPGNAPQRLEIPLTRWSNPAAEGWISGDDHVHVTRKKTDNERMLTLAEAMDVQVLNLLRMGNLVETTFEQYAYGPEGQAQRGRYALVSGQEDPRSGKRGHTLHLNINSPVRSEDYFLYHDVFEALRRQGAVSGYAHFGEGHFNELSGAALDAPFGLIDIGEVLQFGTLTLGAWYEFLNLGFRITPTGGADWPYGSLPGTERTYVNVGSSEDVQSWYRQLKAGNAYVSSGPLIRFEVNGQPPGSELQLKSGEKLTIRANVRQNPDYDSLDRVELVVHGAVVATVRAPDGEAELNLTHEMVPEGGLWLAVRAYGKKYVKAHSAPVYVVVDGDPSWKRRDVPALAADMRKALQDLVTTPAEAFADLEFWATHPRFAAEWQRQLPKLKARVEEADRFYAELARRAAGPDDARRRPETAADARADQ